MDKQVSEKTKTKIVAELIEPLYVNDVKGAITSIKCWKTTSRVFETISKILVAGSGIVSFASGYFGYPVLGFISGSISTVSVAMLQFATYASRENKKTTEELNILLDKLDIERVPVIDNTSSHCDSPRNNSGITSIKQTISDHTIPTEIIPVQNRPSSPRINLNQDEHNDAETVSLTIPIPNEDEDIEIETMPPKETKFNDAINNVSPNN